MLFRFTLLLAMLSAAETAHAVERGNTTPNEKPSATRPNVSHVDITTNQSGRSILIVNYPWKACSRPSVEVCFAPDEKPSDLQEQRPLFFMKKYMRGEVTVDVYRCLDRGRNSPTSTIFSEDDLDFEILGDRNSLGSSAVSITTQTIDPKAGRFSRSVFNLLEPWSLDRATLYLDLPRAQFAKPGQLRVWFLRGSAVLWSETICWPGDTQQ